MSFLQRKDPKETEIKKTAKVFTSPSCLLSGPLTPSYIMLSEEININITQAIFSDTMCPCLILLLKETFPAVSKIWDQVQVILSDLNKQHARGCEIHKIDKEELSIMERYLDWSYSFWTYYCGLTHSGCSKVTFHIKVSHCSIWILQQLGWSVKVSKVGL